MMKFLSIPLILALASCAQGPGSATPENRTERQMLGLLEKFDRWDDNGDGELSASELNHGINGLKGKPQQVNYTPKQVIKFYDTDQNGKVSLVEAQAGYRRADEVKGQLHQ